MPVKIKKVTSWVIFLTCCLSLVTYSYCHAAPCYGTKLPEKNRFFIGAETYNIFKRYLESEQGKVRSRQHFLLLSYGVFDWLSIDLKGGAGNISQHPAGSDEIDYHSGFAGGYGFRAKFYDQKKVKLVFGFQHISVHPYPTRIGNIKHKAILDDWQWSLLGSYTFGRLTPYLGSRWSRVDYIHRIDRDRKRVMSDLTKSAGLVFGADWQLHEKIRINLEGSFFDSQALATSLTYSF